MAKCKGEQILKIRGNFCKIKCYCLFIHCLVLQNGYNIKITFELATLVEGCVTFGMGGPLQLEQFQTNRGSSACSLEITGW